MGYNHWTLKKWPVAVHTPVGGLTNSCTLSFGGSAASPSVACLTPPPHTCSISQYTSLTYAAGPPETITGSFGSTGNFTITRSMRHLNTDLVLAGMPSPGSWTSDDGTTGLCGDETTEDTQMVPEAVAVGD